MKYGSLVFGKENFVLVKYYKETNEMYEDYAHQDTLEILKENMSNALIFDTGDVPTDVVQIHSDITVSTKSGWQETFQLVPPHEEDIKKNKISVVSSLGASVIGLSEGDSLRFGLPGNILGLRIEKVLQRKKPVKLNMSEEIFNKVLPKDCKNAIPLNI